MERTLNERMDQLEKSLKETRNSLQKTQNSLRKTQNSLSGIERSLSEKIDDSHEALLGLITQNKKNIELLLSVRGLQTA